MIRNYSSNFDQMVEPNDWACMRKRAIFRVSSSTVDFLTFSCIGTRFDCALSSFAVAVSELIGFGDLTRCEFGFTGFTIRFSVSATVNELIRGRICADRANAGASAIADDTDNEALASIAIDCVLESIPLNPEFRTRLICIGSDSECDKLNEL